MPPHIAVRCDSAIEIIDRSRGRVGGAGAVSGVLRHSRPLGLQGGCESRVGAVGIDQRVTVYGWLVGRDYFLIR